MMFVFSPDETKLFQKLNTPAKIQNFLETLSINFDSQGQTCYSPRLVIKHRTAQCLEGAMFAAAALQFHGQKPLLVDLQAVKHDMDHVLAVYKYKGCWGAISKTNHAVLRYRDPVYKTIRELVMSYFHEYFLDSGKKTLRSYTNPVSLSRFDKLAWVTSEKEIWYIDDFLDTVKHLPILNQNQIKNLRRADKIEIAAGKIT